MRYSGPDKLQLLVLLTQYNHHHPDDKITTQLTETISKHDPQALEEYMAQKTALRVQYPYNDFQKQARKLQPLLEDVMDLSNSASYEELNWMVLLVAVNDMLKQVRSKWEETVQVRKEHQRKDSLRLAKEIEDAKATKEWKVKAEEHKRITEEREKEEKAKQAVKVLERGKANCLPKDQRPKEEREKSERAKQAVKVVERGKANCLPKDQRPNKLQKKPHGLARLVKGVEPKDQRIEQQEKKAAVLPTSTAPPLPPRCLLPDRNSEKVVIYSPENPLDAHNNYQHISRPSTGSPPLLPPRRESPTEDPGQRTTPPIPPALAARRRSRDGVKKRVSFDDGQPDEGAKAKTKEKKDPVKRDMDKPAPPIPPTPGMPEAWKGSTQPILSLPVIPAKVFLEENAPRKKGKEPHRHKAKMERAHYDALRLASEIAKFSWPGERAKK